MPVGLSHPPLHPTNTKHTGWMKHAFIDPKHTELLEMGQGEVRLGRL